MGNWVHTVGHSAHLLEEMISKVGLEIKFPSLRQSSGNGTSGQRKDT